MPRLTLRTKTFLLILVPTAVLAIYASLSIREAQHQVDRIQQLSDMIVLIDKFSQVEKGLPSEKDSYLDFHPGSSNFGNKTMRQKIQDRTSRFAQTDAAVQDFLEFKKAVDTSRYQNAMSEKLSEVESQLARLPTIRALLKNDFLDFDRDWESIKAYYDALGNHTRTLFVLLSNETENHAIAQRILAYYKASEAYSYSLTAKGMIYWAIQVKNLPKGANVGMNGFFAKEQKAWEELLYFVPDELRDEFINYVQAPEFKQADAYQEDIIQKGEDGDYLIKTEKDFQPAYEYRTGFASKIKDLRDEIDNCIRDYLHDAINRRNRNIIALVLTLIVTGFVSYTMSKRMILSPLSLLSKSMREIASGDGDLTKKLNLKSRDELEELASDFNHFVESIHTIIIGMKQVTKHMHDNGINMVSTSGQLSQISSDMEQETQQVRTSTESISGTSTAIAQNTETIATNLNEISAAVEEMSASINEIARNCSAELNASAEANQAVDHAANVIQTLNTSATEIQGIIGIIQNISRQTNLLALNATIEAASAGAAGKGFTVVAQEVKELAKQSGQATEQIIQRVNSIHKVSTEVNAVVEKIREKISILNTYATTIASAAEEQSATTQEISGNLAHVNDSVHDLAPSVKDLSDSVAKVSDSLSNLNRISKTVQSQSESVDTSSNQILKTLRENETLLGRFIT